MVDRLKALAVVGDDPRVGFGRGCLFALPISLAMWGAILLCVEKIF